MNIDTLSQKAQSLLNSIVKVGNHRSLGSPENKKAVQLITTLLEKYGIDFELNSFDCLDYNDNGSTLSSGDNLFQVITSPYSNPISITSPLKMVSTVEELESVKCEGQILLLKGEICQEQLMPKNFVFYNPEEHQKIIRLLEEKKPAAIITSTKKDVVMAGNIYPFPLIEDGDFNIPIVHCTDVVGEEIISKNNQDFQLIIDGKRIPSSGNNIIARINSDEKKRIIVTAHIDTKNTTPGALDNASGVTALLLLAELLKDFSGNYCIELVILNGEDHYSVAGQMAYLKEYGSSFDNVALAINIDGAGYYKEKTVYSFYECSENVKSTVAKAFSSCKHIAKGQPWFQGDHMIFVQSGISCLAFTSDAAMTLHQTILHTSDDTPDIIDPTHLAEVAAGLKELFEKMK